MGLAPPRGFLHHRIFLGGSIALSLYTRPLEALLS